MEQRPLRLGDIVDDYCPRERRLTNHAIVALVGDVIRQTRCSACDTEHIYKGGQMPKRRKKEDSAFDQVLADVTGGQLRPRLPSNPADQAVGSAAGGVDAPVTGSSAPSRPADPMTASADADHDAAEEPVDDRPEDAWPAHRQLIRATLPRTEADPPPVRPIPEFTMHQRQPQGRGGGFRHSWGGGNGNGNGNGHGFGNGFRQGRPGQGSGFSNGGPGQGQGRHRRRSGRKPK